MISRHMAKATAPSVPGFIGTHSVDLAAVFGQSDIEGHASDAPIHDGIHQPLGGGDVVGVGV